MTLQETPPQVRELHLHHRLPLHGKLRMTASFQTHGSRKPDSLTSPRSPLSWSPYLNWSWSFLVWLP